MKSVVAIASRLSNAMAKVFVRDGIALMEQYFAVTNSNARIYITVLSHAIESSTQVKIQPLSANPAFTVLNITYGTISPEGIGYTETGIEFTARFNGVPTKLHIAYSAVVGIYSPDTPDVSLTAPQVLLVNPDSKFDQALMAEGSLIDNGASEENVSPAQEKKPGLSLVVDNTGKSNAKLH